MSTQPSFRRVHRLTPLLRLWSVILALIAAFALNVNLEALRDIFAFITGEHRGEALRGYRPCARRVRCGLRGRVARLRPVVAPHGLPARRGRAIPAPRTLFHPTAHRAL